MSSRSSPSSFGCPRPASGPDAGADRHQPARRGHHDGPGRSTQVLTVNYFINLYDTLTRWDTALKLQPGLATSWKQVNDTTWDFTLRQGVKFHDGTPLTAEDVKATLDRNIAPGKTVVNAGFTTIECGPGREPDDGAASITKKPDPLLLVRVAQMGAQILPARLTTDDGVKELARRPVGTGAYKFVEWVKDERLVMEANRDWWGWEGKTPAVERIVWKPIPDDFPRLVALEKGEVDIITNVPPDRSQAIADGKSTRLVTVPSTRIVNFAINSTQPPLNDKRVRQALQYAVDVQRDHQEHLRGQGKLLHGGVADMDFGHNPAIKPYPYDPAKAKKLLAEAGHPSGVDVTLYAGTGTMVNDKALLEVIADMWSKVGIRGKVEMMEMGARQRMLNDRAVPPNGDAPRQPAVDAARRRRVAVAHLASQRLQRQVLGGQPARPALPRPDGAGALHAGPEEAQGALRRGDQDPRRGEAVARPVPGARRVRHQQAREFKPRRRLPADRRRDGARGK